MFLLLTPGTAHAVSFNRTTAQSYSNNYTCNAPFVCRNSAYKDFGGKDCTNYVSQALKAGGFPQEKHPYDFWQPEWYYTNSGDYANAWSAVAEFKKYMVDSKKYASLVTTSMSSAYTAASVSDVYMYDWGKGDGYSHLSISPGWGTHLHYYDSEKAKYYDAVTSGSGDWLNQHSNDRLHAPWNWGYWTERDLTVRSKMRTIIIHFNT